jgi:hypothetical protein
VKSNIQRKLALLIGAALALAAFAAPSAMGATQVKNAATGQLCPETVPAAPKTETEKQNFMSVGKTPTYVSGGCTITLQQLEGVELQYPGSSSWTGCAQSTYRIHIGPSGWGYADSFLFNCSIENWYAVGASQPIAPVEYTMGGAIPFFWKNINAETDFNALFRVQPSGWGEAVTNGYASLNVTQALPLRMANQGTGGIKKGNWGPAGGANAGLTVTH